jgi:hypothetical protein
MPGKITALLGQEVLALFVREWNVQSGEADSDKEIFSMYDIEPILFHNAPIIISQSFSIRKIYTDLKIYQ